MKPNLERTWRPRHSGPLLSPGAEPSLASLLGQEHVLVSRVDGSRAVLGAPSVQSHHGGCLHTSSLMLLRPPGTVGPRAVPGPSVSSSCSSHASTCCCSWSVWNCHPHSRRWGGNPGPLRSPCCAVQPAGQGRPFHV